MDDSLKAFRERFVQLASSTGATRLYFGDVVKLFDQTLQEYHDYLQGLPGAPAATLPMESVKELLSTTDPNKDGLGFEEATRMINSLNELQEKKKEAPDQGMKLDESEPQPNGEVLARVAAHTQAVKDGTIKPPEKPELTKVPKGALKGLRES